MKKDIYKIACCFLLFLTCLTLNADFTNIVRNGIRYKISNTPTYPYAEVICFDTPEENQLNYRGKIEIPDNIFEDDINYTVNRLGVRAFDGCSALQELIIPKTVNTLDPFSIANCGDIKLILPDTLNVFGFGALYNTRIKQPFKIPKFIVIDAYFFAAFPWIEEFTFGRYCTRIDRRVFADSNISKVHFEDGKEAHDQLILGEYTFEGSKIEDLRLPNRILIFVNHAFSNSESLSRITIPKCPKIIVVGEESNCECSPNDFYILIEKCPNLKEIVSESPIPPDLYRLPFVLDNLAENPIIMDDNSNTVLKVPAGSEQLYAEHPVWKQFANISDLDGNVYKSALSDVAGGSTQTVTKRMASDGENPISVSISTPSVVSVVNLSGVEICRERIDSGQFSRLLQAGIYIVRVTPI